MIGSGAAGLAAALCAAEHADVNVLARDSWRQSNSARAQGGIAAALDSADSPRFHVEDTLIAGAITVPSKSRPTIFTVTSLAHLHSKSTAGSLRSASPLIVANGT